jgi:DNA-binding GntR family transcriptional regulator
MSKESRAARKAANEASKKADAALHENQRKEKKAGVRDETPEYLRLNAAANEAAAKASWWRR